MLTLYSYLIVETFETMDESFGELAKLLQFRDKEQERVERTEKKKRGELSADDVEMDAWDKEMKVCLFFVTTTIAQTPDGDTPVNEGVCDPLMEDGVTKGLYGLCVAFCESQDLASLDEPISSDDLDTLMAMHSISVGYRFV